MENEVKINLSVSEKLRDELKQIAKDKGMRFHSYISKELEKVRNRELKK